MATNTTTKRTRGNDAKRTQLKTKEDHYNHRLERSTVNPTGCLKRFKVTLKKKMLTALHNSNAISLRKRHFRSVGYHL